MTRVKSHIAKFVPKVIMVIFYRLSKLVIVAKYLALTRGISTISKLSRERNFINIDLTVARLMFYKAHKSCEERQIKV